MKKLLLFLSFAVAVGACSKDNTTPASPQPSRVSGPAVTMGNGTATAWLDLDAQGKPTSIGFTLSKAAFDNLPTTLPGTDYMLALPNEALQKTPFQHIMLNWNPMGHEPVGIYNVPHFDMHFYMVPMSEVMSIPPYAQNPAGFDKTPAPAYLPAGYVKNPGGVPAMGAHWTDVASPEFHGQPFTETFVYGSYNGHVTFWEPMVALSYLKSNPALDKAIPQPTQYEKPALYPTRYSIRTTAEGNQEIAMSQFVQR
ncbi:MAG: DUF5602 domain-containing protein [Hymenobacter sp.]